MGPFYIVLLASGDDVRITRICLENFLSFSDRQEIELKDLNLLVGPNGAGKTNVLRAVTFVGRALTKPFSWTDLSPFAHDVSKPFTVELGVSLSDEEKRALREHLILSLVWSYQDFTTDLKSFSDFLARNGERVVDQPLDITDVIVSNTMSAQYPLELTLKVKWDEGTYYYEPSTRLLGGRRGLLGQQPSYKTVTLSSLVSHRLKELGCSFPPNQPAIVPNEIPPIGIAKIVAEKIGKGNIIIALPGVQPVVTEDRSTQSIRESNWYRHLLEFLAKRGRRDVNITFEDLFSIIFNSSLILLDQWRGRPPKYLELAETTILESSFATLGLKEPPPPEPLVLDAESVTQTLFKLYTSNSAEDRKRFEYIQDKMLQSTGFKPFIVIKTVEKSVERKVPEFRTLPGTGGGLINPPVLTLSDYRETRRVYTYRLAFERRADGRVLPWDQMAAGDVETLFILTALEGYDEKVIMLDEPGQNLHPTSQRWILGVIEEASKKNQILLTTHSSHLVPSDRIQGIIRITRKGDASKIYSIPEEFDADELKLIGKNQALIESLFSHAAIVCEGDTEYWVAQISLPKALGVHSLGDSEVVVVLGEGDRSFRYYNILEKFGVDYFILCDQKTYDKMDEEHKKRCVPFLAKDTSKFLRDEYPDEFQRCMEELKRHNMKDIPVIRCVLERILPPPPVQELAKRLQSDASINRRAHPMAPPSEGAGENVDSW
jgi:energy-coupling factor transporter ATP-binding protein EcfA2